MNAGNWSPIILTLVTFIPLAGALLLLTAILVARHAVRRPEMDGSARAAL